MTPDELEAHVNEIVSRLSDRSGGLNAASVSVRDYITESEMKLHACAVQIEDQQNQIMSLKKIINEWEAVKPKKASKKAK